MGYFLAFFKGGVSFRGKWIHRGGKSANFGHYIFPLLRYENVKGRKVACNFDRWLSSFEEKGSWAGWPLNANFFLLHMWDVVDISCMQLGRGNRHWGATNLFFGKKTPVAEDKFILFLRLYPFPQRKN